MVLPNSNLSVTSSVEYNVNKHSHFENVVMMVLIPVQDLYSRERHSSSAPSIYDLFLWNLIPFALTRRLWSGCVLSALILCCRYLAAAEFYQKNYPLDMTQFIKYRKSNCDLKSRFWKMTCLSGCHWSIATSRDSTRHHKTAVVEHGNKYSCSSFQVTSCIVAWIPKSRWIMKKNFRVISFT